MGKTANYLITGVAGFIGYHLAKRLLDDGFTVIGFDNLNSYYDVRLKKSRLDQLRKYPGFAFMRGDVADGELVVDTVARTRPDTVIHLAAQAGVRYSLENPHTYIQSNIVGFANVLEACRHHPVDQLLYASSSSVYGGNKKVPFSEIDQVDHPVSLYAATKRSNELMADTYAHLYGLRSTALRFFTVYGPYGRPDMAYFKFADLHFSGQPIRLYNSGNELHDLQRDFTYVDDVVESVVRLIHTIHSDDSLHRIFNVGGSNPIRLTDFVETLEAAFSHVLKREVMFDKLYEGAKPGDVHVTYADTRELDGTIGYTPTTELTDGLKEFARWYASFFRITDVVTE